MMAGISSPEARKGMIYLRKMSFRTYDEKNDVKEEVVLSYRKGKWFVWSDKRSEFLNKGDAMEAFVDQITLAINRE